MTETRVPRIGRVLDVVGAVLFLAGAVVYARSWVGLRAMDEFVPGPDGATSALEHADRLSRIGRLGFALMLGGVLVAIAAAAVAKRLARRA